MTDSAIAVRREGPLTHVLLNRPDRGNALSAGMVHELQELLARCAGDGTAVLTLRGAGRHFCTGFDLGNSDNEPDDVLLGRFVRIELVLQAIASAPFVTVALVSGRAVGAGADVVAACEQRWWVEGGGEPALAFPGAAFGIVLGTARLARIVGPDRARGWVRSGRSVGAGEALESGLLQRAVTETALIEALDAIARDATRLDASTRANVHAATRSDQNADDLYRLAGSAAGLGLGARIRAYRLAAK